MKGLSVSAVIPAFNEGRAIAEVVSGVREALGRVAGEAEVLVVDDGSTDDTGEAAGRAGATVLRHPVNRGYGQALRTGVGAARHDWVLMIDADGSYPTSEIDRLFEGAPECDLVIGTRTGVHFWGSPMAAFLRGVYLGIAGFVVGEKVPDANSGLRLVRRGLAAQSGPVECLGFSYSTTMTLSFLKAGRFVKFIPIEFRARVGQSKVRKVRDILRTLQLMTQILIAYNPLKLFVALCASFAAAAAVMAGVFLCRGGWPWLAAAGLSAMAALECFLAGCLLDAIRMRGRGA